MADFRVVVGYDGTLGRIAQQLGTNTKQVVQQAADAAVSQIEADVLPKLAVEPGAVQYPIEWASDRQRAAYFATDGFGHGIPYQRTGNLAKAWEVFTSETPNGALIVLRNPVPAAPFVYGRFNQFSPQQRFHVNTGWLSVYRHRGDVVSAMVAAFAMELYRRAPNVFTN